MLFDHLVVSQVAPQKPAGLVKGPEHIVKKGKYLAANSRTGQRVQRQKSHRAGLD
jgi:hypothetical protein